MEDLIAAKYMIIYKTINLINGKIYVGKDLVDNPKRRPKLERKT